MKLRNKKTGEIVERVDLTIREEGVVFNNDETYNSITELNEDWEDYEEPKKGCYIELYCSNIGIYEDLCLPEEVSEKLKQIGNYFETKEEAEKAVEKLKAWQRLEDKGAEFYGWRRNQTGTYELYLRWEDRIPRSYEVKKDLDLLFGVGDTNVTKSGGEK